MTQRKSFIMHIDSLHVLDELNDEQAGKLFKAIKAYHTSSEINLDFAIKIAFLPFRSQFERDEAKYANISQRNQINGKKPKRAKKADSDSDSDSVSKKESKSKRMFVPPTLEEVVSYFNEKGYNEVGAKKAYDHYVAGEWHDTEGKPVKAWKQKMTTVWFRDEYKIRVAPAKVERDDSW